MQLIYIIDELQKEPIHLPEIFNKKSDVLSLLYGVFGEKSYDNFSSLTH